MNTRTVTQTPTVTLTRTVTNTPTIGTPAPHLETPTAKLRLRRFGPPHRVPTRYGAWDEEPDAAQG